MKALNHNLAENSETTKIDATFQQSYYCPSVTADVASTVRKCEYFEKMGSIAKASKRCETISIV